MIVVLAVWVAAVAVFGLVTFVVWLLEAAGLDLSERVDRILR